MAGLDMNQEYLVLLTVNEEGRPTGLRAREVPRLGTVVRLFSNREKLDAFLEYSDENQRFIDILEQPHILEHFGSEDLNIGYYKNMALPELSPLLGFYDVDHLELDPLTPGAWNRVYPSPHKA